MKENKYDNPVFFQKYSQMSRSQHGLAGAGEWQTFRKILPDFTDRDVLDAVTDGTVNMLRSMEPDLCLALTFHREC